MERCAVGERSKELAAYHEAGHAVAAHALGVEVEGVSIMHYEGSTGHTITPLPENFDSSDEEADAVLEKHLITGVAGAASEELLTEELSELSGKDLEGVAKLLMGLEDAGAPVQADSEEALDKAKSILRDNWDSVRALAEALLKHEELGREGVLAVLENTGR
jgi:ATP-dependent Zn protease